MKKIFINEKQANLLNEMFSETDSFNSLPKSIIYGFKDKDFSKYPFSEDYCKRLLLNGYKNSLSFFSDDISKIEFKDVSNKLSKLINICKKKERPIEEDLSKLCFNTLVEIFDIPNGEIDITTKIVENIPSKMDFHMKSDTDEDIEYDSVSVIREEELEIKKRMLLNMLTYGFAQIIYEKSRKYYLNDLFDLDETLPQLYSKIMKIDNYLLSSNNIINSDNNHNQTGYVNVSLGTDNDTTKIEAVGEIFPVLLYESIKGILELVISNGLPDDIDYASKVLNRADVLEDEPWLMRFGYSICRSIEDIEEIEDTKIYPSLLMIFSSLDAHELLEIFEELAYKTRRGKEIFSSIIRKAKHDYEYNSFQGDLLQKQEGEMLIQDDYFSDDEL